MRERVLQHYAAGGEDARLVATARGRLEIERTMEIVAPLITPGAVVHDIGGGSGRYAEWLTALGADVTLFDPVPLHVEQARARSAGTFAVELADARAIARPDASADVALLLGPLYHLREEAERAEALAEAMRLLRPGGVLVAAGISRFAWLLDAFGKGILGEPGIWASVTRTARGDDDPMTGFPAVFHLPEELRREVAVAGYADVVVRAVEGFGFVLPDLATRLDDPRARRELLDAIALVDAEPSTLGVTSHFLAIARRP